MRTPALIIAFVALVAALALADDAAERTGVARDLEHYYPIRTSLAADKLDGVKAHAEKLAKSDDKAIAKAGDELAKAKEIEPARKIFQDLSKALLAAVEVATKKGEKLGTIYVFECPMAKPYGKWLQETKEIANPYYGDSMLRCGKLINTLAAADAKKADAKKCDCCDDDEKTEKKDEKAGSEKKDGHGDHKRDSSGHKHE